MPHQLRHYNHGRIPIAFVFSAPGAREVEENRPASGKTGENLQVALAYLAQRRPKLFTSTDRYAYRITNAHDAPLARSLGDKRTEAAISEVLKAENVKRVLDEIEGCQHVVLCGRRAQLLAPFIRKAEHQVAEVCHTSSQGLVAAHNTRIAKQGATPGERHGLRILAWADDLLTQLGDERAANS